MAWSQEQLNNARIIINVGQQMGMSKRDIQIALMTAMQESTLRNLNYGDRDSLGLFQQRPSMGWGTASQVMDPVYASRKFYSVLKTVKNRNSMSLTQAAQAVQRSAFPNAYAKWADEAAALLGGNYESAGSESFTTEGSGTITQKVQLPKSELKVDLEAKPTEDAAFQNVSATDGASANVGTGSPAGVESPNAVDDGGDIAENYYTPLQGPAAPTLGQMSLERQVVRDGQIVFGATPTYEITYDVDSMLEQTVSGGGGGGFDVEDIGSARAGVINFARKALGTPYVWGGNSIGRGLDCSGLVQQAFKSIGINLPRLAQDQMNAGRRISRSELRPGDLVAWDYSSRFQGAEHIAIYIGNGKIIEAPRPGRSVQISNLYNVGNAKPYFARILD